MILTPTSASAPKATDQHFWLGQVDADLPRAGVVPDFKRSTVATRAYDAAPFEIDALAVQTLRSLQPQHGVSDVQLCAALVAVLMAKHQREEQFVCGMLAPSLTSSHKQLVPLVLRAGADDDLPAIVASLSTQLEGLGQRELASLEGLPAVLGLEAGANRYPLYDLAFSVGDAGLAIDLARYPLDLAFQFETDNGRLRGQILYARELYERSTIQRAAQQLERVASQLAQTVNGSRATVRKVNVLSASERELLLHRYNERSAKYPLHTTFHALFEAQAARSPAALAVVHRDAELSYLQLNEQANRLAHTLLSAGLKKGEFVGILLQRGCPFLVAMLGVFKAGGAYVPLDPTYPRDRIDYMLRDSQTKLLLTDAAVGAQYADVVLAAPDLRQVLCLTGTLAGTAWSTRREGLALVQPEQLGQAPAHNPMLNLVGTDRAYMIYTSGSTGRPKGAICRHDGALNHLFGELEGIGLSGAFNFLQTAASSSDISVWQFMAPVLVGGTCVVADYETVVDPPALVALLREREVHLAEPVPVVLRALLDYLASLPELQRQLPLLRSMMCTGEALPGELVDRWLQMYPHIAITNTYGPTETSDDVTQYVMREPVGHRFAVAPIGQPLPNVRILVLDAELGLVAPGVPGEVCIAGVAVGEGYWQQPEKTQAAFVPCPFPEVAPGLMYRTGDLGRWLPDGAIEFLGRLDQQVKIRGFRIEPGEIEQVLTAHQDVQDAAVVASTDSMGNKRLVAYCVSKPGAQAQATQLRNFLKERLADHMVPAVIVPLLELPLTPLGKVDRRALARMEVAQAPSSNEAYVAPTAGAQQAVAEAFAQALGTRQVGAQDNFFELGGDSILTIHTVAALRQRGYQVAPRLLFLHPTVAELAAQLQPANAAFSAAPAASPIPDNWTPEAWRQGLKPLFPDLVDVYPLSATQRGIYFQSLLVPKSAGAYVEQIAFDLVGPFNASAFEQACLHWAQHSEPLRTAVVRRGGVPLQVLLKHAALTPASLDWSHLEPEQLGPRLASLEAEERMKGFDLKRPPLARLTLVKLGQDRHRLLLSYHHLILDGWSEPLVLAQLLQTYAALQSGKAAATPSSTPYSNFVAWLEQRDASGSEAYWRKALAGMAQPTNLADPSPAITPPASSEISHGWDVVEVPRATQAALEAMGRRNGITLSTVLHGAWAMLISRNTGAGDVLFGSVSSGRQCELPGVEQVHGLVVATQPLRARVSADLPLTAWLRLLQIQMAEVREHEHTPLASVQNWCEIPPEKRPLFDSLVVVGNYSGSDLAKCAPAGLGIENVSYRTQPLYGLTLFVTVGAQVQISLVYDRKRFAPATAKQLNTQLLQLLAGIGQNVDQRVGSLVERRRLAR